MLFRITLLRLFNEQYSKNVSMEYPDGTLIEKKKKTEYNNIYYVFEEGYFYIFIGTFYIALRFKIKLILVVRLRINCPTTRHISLQKHCKYCRL